MASHVRMPFSTDLPPLAVVFSLIIFFGIIEVRSCVLSVCDVRLMPGAPRRSPSPDG